MTTRLTQEFYARDSIEVARDLLGMRLAHRLENGTTVSGRILETEAYLGVDDPAAHSFAGRRTARTEVMFGEPGFSYIYFIYGVHFCFNVVSAAKDIPEAVLVRALEIKDGNGPGKLCKALGIDRRHNGLDLTRSEILWIERDGAASDVEVISGPRVGIGDRHDAVHWPLRFAIKNHPGISRPKFNLELE
jgi:DNA-3-methyladenine glycosylase